MTQEEIDRAAVEMADSRTLEELQREMSEVWTLTNEQLRARYVTEDAYRVFTTALRIKGEAASAPVRPLPYEQRRRAQGRGDTFRQDWQG